MEQQKTRPAKVKDNVPQDYGETLPFDSWTLLKQWDASMYSKEVDPDDLSPADMLKLPNRKMKFARYVSTNEHYICRFHNFILWFCFLGILLCERN